MTCILSCHWSLCVYLPFSPGRAPQSPPSNVYKRGGGLGGLLGFGWVGASQPQNPPAPYKHSLARARMLIRCRAKGITEGCPVELNPMLPSLQKGAYRGVFWGRDDFAGKLGREGRWRIFPAAKPGGVSSAHTMDGALLLVRCNVTTKTCSDTALYRAEGGGGRG